MPEPVVTDALLPLFRVTRMGRLLPLDTQARSLPLSPSLADAIRRTAAEVATTGRWLVGEAAGPAGSVWLFVAAPVGHDAQVQLVPIQWGVGAGDLDALGPGLTPREREVLRLLLLGHAPRAIARILEISWHTVRTHVKRVYRALDVQTRAEAMSLAFEVARPRVALGALMHLAGAQLVAPAARPHTVA